METSPSTPSTDRTQRDAFDKILARTLGISGVLAAIVRREDPQTQNLEDRLGGDQNHYHTLKKAVDTATIAHLSILSTESVRVNLDKDYVIIVNVHKDGAHGVMLRTRDPGMKSMKRGLRRAWSLGQQS